MDLSGFVVFNQYHQSPYFSITDAGITFNRDTTQLLNFPSFVKVLINNDKKQLLLCPCEKESDGAHKYYTPRKHPIFSVRWNIGSFNYTVKQLIGVSTLGNGYRVDGALIEPNFILFDLTKIRKIT